MRRACYLELFYRVIWLDHLVENFKFSSAAGVSPTSALGYRPDYHSPGNKVNEYRYMGMRSISKSATSVFN